MLVPWPQVRDLHAEVECLAAYAARLAAWACHSPARTAAGGPTEGRPLPHRLPPYPHCPATPQPPSCPAAPPAAGFLPGGCPAPPDASRLKHLQDSRAPVLQQLLHCACELASSSRHPRLTSAPFPRPASSTAPRMGRGRPATAHPAATAFSGATPRPVPMGWSAQVQLEAAAGGVHTGSDTGGVQDHVPAGLAGSAAPGEAGAAGTRQGSLERQGQGEGSCISLEPPGCSHAGTAAAAATLAPRTALVERIQALEAEVARHKAVALAEQRKQGDLTVALRASQRLLSRPLGPSNSPPRWGWGHSQLGGCAVQGPGPEVPWKHRARSTMAARPRPATAGPKLSGQWAAAGWSLQQEQGRAVQAGEQHGG